MRITLRTFCAVVLLIAATLPSVAKAETIYGFQNVTNNIAGDVAIAEAQLFVGVSAVGTNQVQFRFFNTGPLASSITDVYFDDGSLLGIASITNDLSLPGLVNYSQGASPGNLPSGNTINFIPTSGFASDSNPPAQPNGVNPGEELKITFNLQAGKTFADTITALNYGLSLGSASNQTGQPTNLRIGIHVQGFATGGSESLVNGPPDEGGPPPPVPLPAAVMAGGALMGGLGLRRPVRRRA